MTLPQQSELHFRQYLHRRHHRTVLHIRHQSLGVFQPPEQLPADVLQSRSLYDPCVGVVFHPIGENLLGSAAQDVGEQKVLQAAESVFAISHAQNGFTGTLSPPHLIFF